MDMEKKVEALNKRLDKVEVCLVICCIALVWTFYRFHKTLLPWLGDLFK